MGRPFLLFLFHSYMIVSLLFPVVLALSPSSAPDPFTGGRRSVPTLSPSRVGHFICGRRNAAAAVGGAVAVWAPPSLSAHAAKATIEEINARRAKIGLAPLDVIQGDGSWAMHTGAFTDSFFDDSFTKRPDGLTFKFVNQPEGQKPVPAQMVSVYYTGYLEDGTKFDSAYDKGRPFDFRLGKQTVISGWEAVVGGMRLGQKVIVKLPPKYAYGSKGVGPIPPNSNLIFYMELVNLGDVLGK